jgi:hypothetical protein
LSFSLLLGPIYRTLESWGLLPLPKFHFALSRLEVCQLYFQSKEGGRAVTSVVVRLSLDFYGKMVFASCVVFTSELSFSLVSFVRKEVSSLLFFPSVR